MRLPAGTRLCSSWGLCPELASEPGTRPVASPGCDEVVTCLLVHSFWSCLRPLPACQLPVGPWRARAEPGQVQRDKDHPQGWGGGGRESRARRKRKGGREGQGRAREQPLTGQEAGPWGVRSPSGSSFLLNISWRLRGRGCCPPVWAQCVPAVWGPLTMSSGRWTLGPFIVRSVGLAG